MSFAFAFATSLAGAAAPFPEPFPDDNGDHAFVREVTPILWGRRPKGALEVKMLGDVAALGIFPDSKLPSDGLMRALTGRQSRKSLYLPVGSVSIHHLKVAADQALRRRGFLV